MTVKELQCLERSYRSYDGTVDSELHKRGIAERNFSMVLSAALLLAEEVESLKECGERKPVYKPTREDDILCRSEITDNKEMQNFEQHK